MSLSLYIHIYISLSLSLSGSRSLYTYIRTHIGFLFRFGAFCRRHVAKALAVLVHVYRPPGLLSCELRFTTLEMKALKSLRFRGYGFRV